MLPLISSSHYNNNVLHCSVSVINCQSKTNGFVGELVPATLNRCQKCYSKYIHSSGLAMGKIIVIHRISATDKFELYLSIFSEYSFFHINDQIA